VTLPATPTQLRSETLGNMRIRTIHLGTAVALLPFILLAPMLGLDWELRPVMQPVLITSAIVAPFLIMGWISTTEGRGWVKLLAMFAVLVAGAMMVLVSLLTSLFQATTTSLPLQGGCRVDADSIGGFGDSLLVVRHVCPRLGLWQRSTPLISDEEAVVTALGPAPASPGGVARFAVTLSRYGKPDEQRMLLIPPQ